MRDNKNRSQEFSAWLREEGVSFSQKSVNAKDKKIEAIKQLLDVVSVEHQIVNIHDIGTQTSIIEKIKTLKGDYVLTVKTNQKNLYTDILTYLNNEQFQNKEKSNYFQTVRKAHERKEYKKDSIIKQVALNGWKAKRTSMD